MKHVCKAPELKTHQFVTYIKLMYLLVKLHIFQLLFYASEATKK